MSSQLDSASAALASPNFSHLAAIAPLLALEGAKAERYVFADPTTALFKLRRFGEVLAQEVAAAVGLYTSSEEAQIDLLRRLKDGGIIDFEVADLFHALRKAGNLAVHDGVGSQREALHGLRLAWKLGVWFQRGFKDAAFKSGAFLPPPDPRQAEAALKEELAQLRQTLADQQAQLSDLQATAKEQSDLRARAKAEAKAAYEDLAVAMDLAGESEAKAAKLEAEFKARLEAVQAAATATTPAVAAAVVQQAKVASNHLDLDESETRLLIDAQLVAAGWEADTLALSYKAGARPTKGCNRAIAEWPTAKGPADYVLFVGEMPIAIVEAKRQAKDIPAAIEQAKRYSRGYEFSGEPAPAGCPWGEFQLPFLFATNGRPFLRQLKTQSGIWFLDARRSTNHARPLQDWYSPQGLIELLGQDLGKADAKLQAEPSSYLPLRDYQHAAIAAVERGLANGRQDMLLAMATGTGKTRLALCLIYRLLKAGRFRRVLFLVDRTSLGEQALGSFADVRLENLQALTEIYEVKGLGDLKPETDTRLHVATVQGMVQRLLYPADGQTWLPVDTYDCIVVDECHRGYALDQEMTESQLLWRSEDDYIGKFRRVIDHFDAVRIGLTATPALHTSQIFGPPIYEYGYRQAVIDGHLIDHEPPFRLMTKLNQKGIHWQRGEEVALFHTATGQLQLFNTPDDIDRDVADFNTKVLTESFNQAVCEALAQEIDPMAPNAGKTMIFCATDAHADQVVALLKSALAERYGPIEDDAVMKITGAADRPLAKLRLFKNERLPAIAVTVDLLTTGIDVPAIVNLVFLRRVRSRILYEQMLGRATRLCPEIGKETFRIYDAVDLYAALQPYTAMKPVVTRPSIPFAQLAQELASVPDPVHQQSVIDEFVAKLQAKRQRIQGEHLQAFADVAGMTPADLVGLLRQRDVAKAQAFFAEHPGVAEFLDRLQVREGRVLLVSEHQDEFLGSERGYGTATRPEDYLAGFRAYLEQNKNAVDALIIVTQRPRDLTRKQLRELKLQLDSAGYPESALRTAWAQVSNQDIAASIVGFIRQQALGSPLLPYAERVDRALLRVLSSQPWLPPQRQWLTRIARQIKEETVVDREALDRGQFQAEGGYQRLNRVFDGRLEQVLAALHEEVWREAA